MSAAIITWIQTFQSNSMTGGVCATSLGAERFRSVLGFRGFDYASGWKLILRLAGCHRLDLGRLHCSETRVCWYRVLDNHQGMHFK